MRRQTSLRVGIIGAGYAGLALARAFQQLHEPPQVTLFESREAVDSVQIGGELELPSGGAVMDALGLHDEWSALESVGSRPSCVPLQPLLSLLARSLLPSTIKYRHSVTKITQHGSERAIHVKCTDEGLKRFIVDLVVLAPGLRSYVEVEPGAVGVLVVGDARWVANRWWDFGSARINRGADIALQDAVALGITHSQQVLGRSEHSVDALRLVKYVWRGSSLFRVWRLFLLVVVTIVFGPTMKYKLQQA